MMIPAQWATEKKGTPVEVAVYEPGIPSWIDMLASDPAAAIEFYSALFGWDAMDAHDGMGGSRLCYLRGRPVAAISPRPGPDGPAEWLTYVSVADADATAAAVRSAGGQVVREPADLGGAGRTAVFVDPTDAAFAIWQPGQHIGAELVNEPGTLRRNELTTRQGELAIPFYAAVFGWDAVDTHIPAITDWQLNGSTIAGLTQMDDRWPADVPSHWQVVFDVADVPAAAERARSLGAVVYVPPTGIPVGMFSDLGDPQGAPFTLLSLSLGGDATT